jgi:phage tail sheath protein FI
MVNILSPAVYFIEKDLSEFAPTINSSVVGIVGFAKKGPLNKATLITSPQSLIQNFGEPAASIQGQALEGALEILEATNTVYFVRAGDSTTAANASATMQYGACPAIEVSANAFGVTNPLYLKVQVTDNAGTSGFTEAKTYNIPAATVAGDGNGQAQALRKVLGGTLDADKVGAQFSTDTSSQGFIVGSWAGSGASLMVSAFSDAALSVGVSALRPLGLDGVASSLDADYPAASSLQVWGVTLDTSGLSYVAQSQNPGEGYNGGTKTDGTTSGNSMQVVKQGGHTTQLSVNQDGTKQEDFKVGLISNSDYIEDKINTGTTSLKSDIIKGELYFSSAPATPVALSSFPANITDIGLSRAIAGEGVTPVGMGDTSQSTFSVDYNPRFVKLLEVTNNLGSGNDGIANTDAARAADLIGTATSEPKTGMQVLDDPVLNIGLAIVPGITNQSVQNALITLAEQTQEFFAVVSPPFGVGSVQNAIDWTNGQSDTRTAAINSSWAGVYWPWVKSFSVFDEDDVWLDPGIFGIRQMAVTDNVAETWFAPAGYRRGRLTKPTEVEVKLNKGDRDSLYTGGNILNPIVNFTQQGITIFGQKTTQRNPTALQSINIRRLMIFLRKVIIIACRNFLFEPNDEFTWEQIENVVNPLLDDIKRRRGITEFKAICDATTNTPVRVDRNELWCKILLKPTKTAEAIVFEVNLTNQSADLGN